jgi:hypothetical protein
MRFDIRIAFMFDSLSPAADQMVKTGERNQQLSSRHRQHGRSRPRGAKVMPPPRVHAK